ncbi:hypothetical protein PHLGIDRAFT_420996 [Phlebiopsis gigantea 11061_1 CR5-6]|uniref:Uncharacterized protein n=1 Tax=Phlebiopsis gigantea (strain 11061_1 CR5-6) TaxID=745531 RepID=A0A0C3S8I5_PHLG1|nr:hypothetical protein PHLGIDRAFT_420996 [Phlebiopsis gigantea 11061_1 CR5-6]
MPSSSDGVSDATRTGLARGDMGCCRLFVSVLPRTATALSGSWWAASRTGRGAGPSHDVESWGDFWGWHNGARHAKLRRRGQVLRAKPSHGRAFPRASSTRRRAATSCPAHRFPRVTGRRHDTCRAGKAGQRTINSGARSGCLSQIPGHAQCASRRREAPPPPQRKKDRPGNAPSATPPSTACRPRTRRRHERAARCGRGRLAIGQRNPQGPCPLRSRLPSIGPATVRARPRRAQSIKAAGCPASEDEITRSRRGVGISIRVGGYREQYIARNLACFFLFSFSFSSSNGGGARASASARPRARSRYRVLASNHRASAKKQRPAAKPGVSLRVGIRLAVTGGQNYNIWYKACKLGGEGTRGGSRKARLVKHSKEPHTKDKTSNVAKPMYGREKKDAVCDGKEGREGPHRRSKVKAGARFRVCKYVYQINSGSAGGRADNTGCTVG